MAEIKLHWVKASHLVRCVDNGKMLIGTKMDKALVYLYMERARDPFRSSGANKARPRGDACRGCVWSVLEPSGGVCGNCRQVGRRNTERNAIFWAYRILC